MVIEPASPPVAPIAGLTWLGSDPVGNTVAWTGGSGAEPRSIRDAMSAVAALLLGLTLSATLAARRRRQTRASEPSGDEAPAQPPEPAELSAG